MSKKTKKAKKTTAKKAAAKKAPKKPSTGWAGPRVKVLGTSWGGARKK